VYQVGINKGIILRCTAYQISRKEGCWITFYYYVITLGTTAILSVTEVINLTQSLNLTKKQSQRSLWCSGWIFGGSNMADSD